MKNYLVTLNVRHGENVALRQHYVIGLTNGQCPVKCALHAEASNVGATFDQLEERDGGWYSPTWEFHFSENTVTGVSPEDAAVLDTLLIVS